MQEIQSPNQGKGNDNGNDNGQLCCRLSHNSSEILLTTLAALYYVTLTESACKKLIVMTMAITMAMTMGRGHLRIPVRSCDNVGGLMLCNINKILVQEINCNDNGNDNGQRSSVRAC